jgi:hypothetical protein
VRLFALAVLAFLPDDGDRVLFDFESDDEISCWGPLELPDAPEPAARAEASREHAAAGARSLKITFAGGVWPAVRAAAVPPDWAAWNTFRADVTVTRPCLAGFRVMQEKSSRKRGYDEGVTRWEKTAFLKPGRNEVVGALQPNGWSAVNPRFGKVISLEIYLYRPRREESIWVDHIRLSPRKPPPAAPPGTRFRVLGTDREVSGVRELGERLKDRWTKPEARTVGQEEEDFKALHEKLKADHPKAVRVTLRDGGEGYSGWKDAYWSSHGPDGLTVDRAENLGRSGAHEVFMRHRSPLMRVDLSGIPEGSRILAARLLLVRAGGLGKEHDPERRPTMWVAEACNRPWEEFEVNAYEYARDRFWKEIGGAWYGEDPDFLPVYLAHGPGAPGVSAWDFTEAVRFWTEGKHPNHGFMLHGDSKDYMRAWSREAPDVKNRPALLVVYSPP